MHLPATHSVKEGSWLQTNHADRCGASKSACLQEVFVSEEIPVVSSAISVDKVVWVLLCMGEFLFF